MTPAFERVSDQKRLAFIVDALKNRLPAGATVLDVGCGNGIISQGLGQLGFSVLGVDVSEKTIAQARKLNTLPNVRFEVRSAEAIAAGAQKYSAVVCSEVLEHLNQPHLLVRTLYQCLAPDGVLVVTVPNGIGPRELLVTRPVQALQEKNNFVWRALSKVKQTLGYTGTTVQSSAEDLRHVQFFTKSSLERLAVDNGFRIVRFGKTNFVEDVFPFSLLTKRAKLLQRLDCALASILPHEMNGGFITVWEKQKS